MLGVVPLALDSPGAVSPLAKSPSSSTCDKRRLISRGMRSVLIDPPKAYLRYLDIPGPELPIVYMHGLGCAATVDFAVVATRPQLARRRHLLVDFFGQRPIELRISWRAVHRLRNSWWAVVSVTRTS
jgi:hypothetical protein